MELKDINRNSTEGQLLIIAISALTVSPKIMLDGKEFNGRELSPTQVIDLLEITAGEVFSHETEKH
jgi:hypothetical protein